MSKILVTCTLLCSLALYFELADAVKDLHGANPASVAIAGYSYTLWKTNTSIYLNSTKEDFKPCTISIDPVKDYTMRIQAKPLSDHKFILWGIRSFEIPKSRYNGLSSLNYTVLIIDSSLCSYKAVFIPEDKIPYDNWPFLSSHVLPSTDGFDFFSPSHGKCSPCRFSFEGEPISIGYQLKSEKVDSDYARYIESLDENDLSKGYIITNNSIRENTAFIKHVNSKFKVVRQLQLQHPIHSLSINNKNQPIISICYASQNTADSFWEQNFQVNCEQLDSDFKSKLKFRLPVPKEQYVFGLGGITHKVDSLGNLFVGLLQLDIRKSSSLIAPKLRFFAFDKFGKIIETHDYEDTKPQKGHAMADLRSYFSANKEFCIVTNLITDTEDFISPADVQEIITCVDVSKYLM